MEGPTLPLVVLELRWGVELRAWGGAWKIHDDAQVLARVRVSAYTREHSRSLILVPPKCAVLNAQAPILACPDNVPRFHSVGATQRRGRGEQTYPLIAAEDGTRVDCVNVLLECRTRRR